MRDLTRRLSALEAQRSKSGYRQIVIGLMATTPTSSASLPSVRQARRCWPCRTTGANPYRSL